MLPMRPFTLILGFAMAVSACDVPFPIGPKKPADGNALCSHYVPSSKTLDDVAMARRAIYKILAATPTCTADETDQACELVSYRTGSHDLQWKDADPNQVILFLDGRGDCHLMRDASETRYRSRIVARYSLDATGNYSACSNSGRLPRALAEIYFDTPGTSHFIPAKGLGVDLLRAVDDKFPEHRGFAYTHGDPIFTAMAEYNPQATFVLAQLPGSQLETELCSASEDSLRDIDRHVAESLKEIVREHGISYVVYSAGTTRDNMWLTVSSRCPGVKNLEERTDLAYTILAGWERQLSNIPGVAFVQAGARIAENSSLEDFIPDCETTGAPNRLRVGHFNAPGATFGQTGVALADAPWEQWIPPEYRGARSCIDIYVNSGLHPLAGDELIAKAGPFPAESAPPPGIGSGAYPIMSSSYTTPIAVSYLIHAKTTGGSADPRRLFAEITLDGTRKLHDPIRNENFESFRLGKAWYQEAPLCCLSR